MKNITVFAVLVIILMPLSPPEASALENYSFSVASRFGLFYGQAEEIVYLSTTNHPLRSRKDFLSQLLWDMKPVYYYGVLLDYSQTKPMEHRGFFSSLSIKTAIPGLSGKMEDRDWDSQVNNDLTHFSSHDNLTEHIFWMDVSAGLSFPFWSMFLLKANMAFSYMHFEFSASDGYGRYARETSQSDIYYPITDNPHQSTFEGTVISYSQEWLCLSPGISLEYYFLKAFYFKLLFQISPLVLCVDLDKHYYRTRPHRLFKDYMFGGLFMEPRAVLSFTANKWLSLSLEASYRHIGGTRGETFWREVGKGVDFVSTGEAGAGLSIFDFGLTTTIRL
jgi:outer membrane protease